MWYDIIILLKHIITYVLYQFIWDTKINQYTKLSISYSIKTILLMFSYFSIPINSSTNSYDAYNNIPNVFYALWKLEIETALLFFAKLYANILCVSTYSTWQIHTLFSSYFLPCHEEENYPSIFTEKVFRSWFHTQLEGVMRKSLFFVQRHQGITFLRMQ